MSEDASISNNDFSAMMEIWRMSALDQIREKFYSKELEAAKREARIQIALEHDVESIPVSEERIRAIIDGDDPKSHSEFLVSGFDKALRLICREYERMDFDERTILSIHRTLFSDLLCEKGAFKPECVEGVDQMIQAYAESKKDPLSKISYAIERFDDISPFRDGNKRMSALLRSFLLLKSGFKAHLYVPLDDSLPTIDALLSSYTELDRRYPLVESKKAKKRDRILRIIETSESPVSKRSICTCIPDVSIRTADVVLSDLIEQKKVVKIGTYKDARYMLA